MQGKSPSGEPAKQLAIEGVRLAILRGELVAGQRLIEPDLAEMLGVNRSSVRAALIDLAAEGLVERMPNKGARVRIVPVAEAIAINECPAVSGRRRRRGRRPPVRLDLVGSGPGVTARDRRALGRKAGNRAGRTCKVNCVSRSYWRFTTAPGGAARNHAR